MYKTPDGTQNFLKTGVKKNNGATEADGQELDHELLLAAGTSTRKMFIFLPTSPGEETLRGNKMCVWAQPAPVQEKKHFVSQKPFSSIMRKLLGSCFVYIFTLNALLKQVYSSFQITVSLPAN